MYDIRQAIQHLSTNMKNLKFWNNFIDSFKRSPEMKTKEAKQVPKMDFKVLYTIGLRIARGLSNGKTPDGYRLEQIVTGKEGRTGIVISYLDHNSPLSPVFGKSFGYERVYKLIKLNKENKEESIEIYQLKR